MDSAVAENATTSTRGRQATHVKSVKLNRDRVARRLALAVAKQSADSQKLKHLYVKLTV